MKSVFMWLLISVYIATMLGCGNPLPGNDSNTAGAQPNASDETRDINFAIHELWEAYCAQDEERLNAIIDNDYVNSDGVGKKEIIKRYLAPSLICKSVDIGYETAKIQLKGDRAVVTYRAKYTVSQDGKPLLIDNLSTDVFIKKNGKWRVLRGSAEEDVKRDTSQ